MAEFCKQCAEEMGFEPDFVGLCNEEQVAVVICEGCGPTMVNHKGECVSKDCLLKHGVSHA